MARLLLPATLLFSLLVGAFAADEPAKAQQVADSAMQYMLKFQKPEAPAKEDLSPKPRSLDVADGSAKAQQVADSAMQTMLKFQKPVAPAKEVVTTKAAESNSIPKDLSPKPRSLDVADGSAKAQQVADTGQQGVYSADGATKSQLSSSHVQPGEQSGVYSADQEPSAYAQPTEQTYRQPQVTQVTTKASPMFSMEIAKETTTLATTTMAMTTHKMSAPEAAFDKILHKKKLSLDAQQVVGGLIEAFMHKVQLDPEEKTCLENSISTFASDVIGTCQDAVIAIQDLVKSQGNGGKLGKDNPLAFAMDGAVKITSMVGLGGTLAKKCVKKGDALKMLDLAKDHITSIKYLEKRVLVSGVDIAKELSTSILDWEKSDYHGFGWQIGTSLRKIILSTSNKGTKLPEGIPKERIIEKVSEGVMDGFFANGAEVDVTNAVDPRINIKLDLHQCIAGNSEFFNTIFHGIWTLFAQLAVNKDQHGLKENGRSTGVDGQDIWSKELMMTMMQLPSALNNCGVSPQAEEMFMQAVQSLKSDNVAFVFPPDAVSRAGKALPLGEEVEINLAKAIKYWTDFKFRKFGLKLGQLFRTSLLQMMPQKYEVDENGHLRRKLENTAHQVATSATSAPAAVRLAAGAAALFSFFVLFTVRCGVASWRRRGTSLSESQAFAQMDLEADQEAVE